LRHVAFLLTDDQREADDLLEATLARSLVRWSRIDDDNDDPYGFVLAMLIDAHRSLWRHLQHRRAGGAQSAVTGDDADVADELRDGLPRLRGMEREVVVLRVFEGLDAGETAGVLHTSTANVSRHMAKAIARVRAASALAPAPLDRAARVRRLASHRRRGVATAGVVSGLAALAAAILVVVVHDADAPGTAPAAAAGPPRATRSASSFVVALSPATALAPTLSGGLFLRRGVIGDDHEGFWVYDAETMLPMRRVTHPEAAGDIVAAVIDPDRDNDRVVFIRQWKIGSGCVSLPCAGGARTFASDSPDDRLAWRIFASSLTTGAESPLNHTALGAAPTHLFFSPGGRVLGVASTNDVLIMGMSGGDTSIQRIVLDVSTAERPLGFLNDFGPLLLSETDQHAPGRTLATRQWVTAVDRDDPSRRTTVYDSGRVPCEPTERLWLLPRGQLALATRCGKRTDVPDELAVDIYLAEADGVRLVEKSRWPGPYREELAVDSTGTVLIEEFTPLCSGERVVDRILFTGGRTRVIGKGPPTCRSTS
ncbi:MAG: polymerase, sigma-24 subunit, subfamily, partial [Frankiales bacterium]|nr:polymerase, sigma-24 subunit, subfamily [Frankiales bacterium]